MGMTYNLDCLFYSMERQHESTLNQRKDQDLSSKKNKETLEWMKLVEEVQEVIGYTFKNLKLLFQIFSHISFHREDKCESYERLEFIGDSVLNLVIAKEHYLLYPDLLPGQLTRLRAANVDTENVLESLSNTISISTYDTKCLY